MALLHNASVVSERMTSHLAKLVLGWTTHKTNVIGHHRRSFTVAGPRMESAAAWFSGWAFLETGEWRL